MRKKFIVVDDDRTNNIICQLTIRKFKEDAVIHLFNQPEKGLSWITNNGLKRDTDKFILFLDINMPTMTGWEFLDEFVKLDDKVKNRFKIYILSSSIEDFTEKEATYPFISGFLSKPLRESYLPKICNSKTEKLLGVGND